MTESAKLSAPRGIKVQRQKTSGVTSRVISHPENYHEYSTQVLEVKLMTGNHVKGTLVAGFILGAAAGCTAAFLLAPATGKDSRKAIKTKTVRVTSAVKSRVTKQPETIAEPEFAI